VASGLIFSTEPHPTATATRTIKQVRIRRPGYPTFTTSAKSVCAASHRSARGR
jgi:hypothetical protein